MRSRTAVPGVLTGDNRAATFTAERAAGTQVATITHQPMEVSQRAPLTALLADMALDHSQSRRPVDAIVPLPYLLAQTLASRI